MGTPTGSGAHFCWGDARTQTGLATGSLSTQSGYLNVPLFKLVSIFIGVRKVGNQCLAAVIKVDIDRTCCTFFKVGALAKMDYCIRTVLFCADIKAFFIQFSFWNIEVNIRAIVFVESNDFEKPIRCIAHIN